MRRGVLHFCMVMMAAFAACDGPGPSAQTSSAAVNELGAPTRILYRWFGGRPDRLRSLTYDLGTQRVHGEIRYNSAHGGPHVDVDVAMPLSAFAHVPRFIADAQSRLTTCQAELDGGGNTVLSVEFDGGGRVFLGIRGPRSARCIAVTHAEAEALEQPFETLIAERLRAAGVQEAE